MVDPKGKYFVLPLSVSDDELGRSILACLAASRWVLPRKRTLQTALEIAKYNGIPLEEVPDVPPEVEYDYELYDPAAVKTRYEEWIASMKKRFGYKTKKRLFENMKSCSVASVDGIVTISPSHHERLEGWSGLRKNFEESKVRLPLDSPPHEIGSALRLAFGRCTG